MSLNVTQTVKKCHVFKLLNQTLLKYVNVIAFLSDCMRLYNLPCIFCRIILMAEGKVAFSGPVTHALEFFKRYILLNCDSRR